ncbi:MAG: diaminopimelate decarboxylase [Pseudomonadota bacterium]
MTAFSYANGDYRAERVRLQDIAATCGTPFYCYSRAGIESAYRRYETAFSGLDVTICYALKANSNQSVITLLANLGAGADVVSGGELRRAIAAGIPPERIVFSGVAKTAAEIELALAHGIRQFNVESDPELRTISQVAERLGRTASIAYRINPDIDAGTHEKISTGKSENKFGIPWQSARQAYAAAAKLPGIRIAGVDMHIGSQILRLEPYRRAFERIATLVEALREDGHEIATVDLGGGLGVDYGNGDPKAPSPEEYAEAVAELVARLDCRCIVEPGRSLVANAGVLVGSVIYVKEGSSARFLIIDAAMNDFLRPSMYSAHHNIVPARQNGHAEFVYDIVGPVCETGDTFARQRALPEQSPGDLVVIEGAGAYGSVMASSYNTRLLVPEVLVDGDDYRVVRRRPDYESLIGLDLAWDDGVKTC